MAQFKSQTYPLSRKGQDFLVDYFINLKHSGGKVISLKEFGLFLPNQGKLALKLTKCFLGNPTKFLKTFKTLKFEFASHETFSVYVCVCAIMHVYVHLSIVQGLLKIIIRAYDGSNQLLTIKSFRIQDGRKQDLNYSNLTLVQKHEEVTHIL